MTACYLFASTYQEFRKEQQYKYFQNDEVLTGNLVDLLIGKGTK